MPITGSAEAARPGRKDEAGGRPGRRPNGTGGEAGPRRRPSLPVPCPRAGTWADPRLLRSLFPTDGPPSSHHRAGSGSGACTSHPGRSRTCRPRFKSPRPPPRWPWEGSCDDLRPAAGAVGSSGEGHGLRPASCAPGLTDGATELLPEASSPVFAPVLSAQSPEQHPDLGPSAGRCRGPRRPPRLLPAPPGGRHLNTAADGCPLRSPRWSTGNTRGSLASMSPRQQPPWPQHRPAASARALPGRVRPRCGGAPTAGSQSDPWWRRAWRRGTSPPLPATLRPPFSFFIITVIFTV